MDLLLARPCRQSDKAHSIGADIGVVNSHSVILPEQRVQARTELYTLQADPDLPRQCNRSLPGVVSGSVNRICHRRDEINIATSNG
jgi:hypothetical protein